LINLRGEVMGINSQIYSRSGGFMGISFAIPIDEAMRVADQLRTAGRVIRGRIGVQIDQVTKEVAESSASERRWVPWSAAWRLAGRPKKRPGGWRHHHQVRWPGHRKGCGPAAYRGQHEAG
jgi:hypothetical protein